MLMTLAANIAKIANKNGIKTLNAFFDESILKKIHNQNGYDQFIEV